VSKALALVLAVAAVFGGCADPEGGSGAHAPAGDCAQLEPGDFSHSLKVKVVDIRDEPVLDANASLYVTDTHSSSVRHLDWGVPDADGCVLLETNEDGPYTLWGWTPTGEDGCRLSGKQELSSLPEGKAASRTLELHRSCPIDP
jgi:hypothetical protein